MSDLAAVCDRRHSRAPSVAPGGRTATERSAWVEKIMSKTNDTSRELTSDELDAVSGGDGRHFADAEIVH